MKNNKFGQRIIHLHDKDIVEFVEKKSKESNRPMYEIVEEMLLNEIHKSNESVEENIPSVCLDVVDVFDLVEALNRDGYELKVMPICDDEGYVVKARVWFKK